MTNCYRHIKSLIAAILFILILLAYSGINLPIYAENDPDRTDTVSDVLRDLSERDQAKPVIIIGDDVNYPPYSFLDSSGNPAGYNIDLARAAGAAMGYDVIIKLDNWDKTRQALENGDIDAIAGMFYTESRSEVYSFTTRHSTTSGAIFASSGNEINSLEELAGQQVAVQRADIVAEILQELNTRLNLEIELIETSTVSEALNLVETGNTDYAGLLKLPALYEIDNSELENVHDQQIDFFSNDYSMAVRKGNEDLAAILNGGLQIIKADGTYQRIYDRWLGVYEPMDVNRILTRYRLIPIIVIGLLLLLIIISTVMHKIVKRKTAELRKVNEILIEKQNQLEYISDHDALTGLYNRRYFERMIRQLSGNLDIPLCLVIGDVNNLKTTNDELGHQVGDQLLIKVAQIIQNQISSTNTACRIGGDEFVILMPGAETFEAESLIRRIRAAASREQSGPVDISISFGLSCISDNNTDIMEAFRQAENLMYDNKNFEKKKFNRIISFTNDNNESEISEKQIPEEDK